MSLEFQGSELATANLELQTYKLFRGGSRIRTYEDISQQIYSLPQLAALVFPQMLQKDLELPVKKRPASACFLKEVQNYTLFDLIQINEIKIIKIPALAPP